jgi:hypothetical protein
MHPRTSLFRLSASMSALAFLHLETSLHQTTCNSTGDSRVGKTTFLSLWCSQHQLRARANQPDNKPASHGIRLSSPHSRSLQANVAAQPACAVEHAPHNHLLLQKRGRPFQNGFTTPHYTLGKQQRHHSSPRTKVHNHMLPTRVLTVEVGSWYRAVQWDVKCMRKTCG